jgi:hypothetical protein
MLRHALGVVSVAHDSADMMNWWLVVGGGRRLVVGFC